MSTKPTHEEIMALKEAASEVAQAMTKAMFEAHQSQRAAMIGSIRVAAGTAAMGGMDLHRAIHMFMTFYKEADKAFEERSKL